MQKLYPYINHQGDLEAAVESEIKLKQGIELSPVFISKLLKYRRVTILKGMKAKANISFARLGKFKINPRSLDKADIKEKLGENYNSTSFKKELDRRFKNGELKSQKGNRIKYLIRRYKHTLKVAE